MRLYELTAIFPTEEALLKEGRDALERDLSNAGVTIENTDEKLGDRELAYQIGKYRRGHYVCYTLRLDPEKVAGLDKSFHLNPNLLRYLFVRVD
jgi:small subunit ribosomal protein S6